MANYSNTYSMKLDKTDFDSKLASLSTAYNTAMNQMEGSSKDLLNAKKELTRVETIKNTELKKGIQTSAQVNKQFKEQLAVAKSSVAMESQRNKAHKQNVQNLKEQIGNLKEVYAGETKLAQAVRESHNQRKKSIVSFKEKIGVITKAEIVLREYAYEMRKVAIAEKKGILTTQQATVARKHLTNAKKQDLLATKQSVAYRNTAINGLVRHIRKVESLVIAFYALKKSYDFTLGLGHEFNKMMESEQIGIALSITQKLKDVDVTGKQVTALEKWTYANKLARQEMEEVRKINVFTPHTLGQTVQLYKVISVQTREAHGDAQDALDITKQLSILAQAGNVEFKSMLKTVDQLFSGKMKASDMQIALQNIVGLTQEGTREAIKQGNVLEYVKQKLIGVEIASIDVANTWEGVTSNFQNAWTDIFATVQKPLFDNMKEGMRDFSTELIENKDDIVDTFFALGEGIKYAYDYLDEFVIAYVGFTTVSKLGTFVSMQKNMDIHNKLTTTAIFKTRALTIAQTALGAVINPLNIAVALGTVAWSLYSDAEDKVEAQEKSLSKAMGRTIGQVERLHVARLKSSKLSLDKGIVDQEKILNDLENSRYARQARGQNNLERKIKLSKDETTILDGQLQKEKEKLKELQNQSKIYGETIVKIEESKDKIDFLTQGATAFTDELYKSLLASEKLTRSLANAVAEFNKAVRVGQVLGGNMTTNQLKVLDAESKLVLATKARVSAYETLDKIQKTDGGRGTDKSDALTKQKDVALKALSAERQAQNTLTDIGNKLNVTGIELEHEKKLLLQGEITLQDRLDGKKTASADGALRTAEATYDLAKKKINLNIKGLSDEAKSVELAKAKLTLEIANRDHADAIATSNEKSAKASRVKANKEPDFEDYKLKSQLALLDSQIDIIDSTNDWGVALDGVAKSVMDVAKAYGSVQTDALKSQKAQIKLDRAYNKNKKKFAGKNDKLEEIKVDYIRDTAKITEDARSQEIAGYSALAGAMSSSFEEGSAGARAFMAVQQGLALYNAVTAVTGAWASAPFPYNLPAVAITTLSVASLLGQIGSTFSGGGTPSEANIELARGESSSNYTDESLSNIMGAYEDAQYPMLQVTHSIDRHLRSMDDNFYSIARAISGTTTGSGIDITGANVTQGVYDASMFSSKSVDLIGAGLVFKKQTLAEMSDVEDLYIKSYESIQTTKENLFKTSVKLYTTVSKLPVGVREDFADAFASGYESLFEAGVLLGLDEVDLSTALAEATIKLGDKDGKIDLSGLDDAGVADALNNIFSTAFSQVVDQIGDFDKLVDRYASGTEESLETLLRVALEFDQASHQFNLIGKTFYDGLEDFTEQLQILDIVESTGGLDEFNDAMGSFMSGFYTDAEQLEFLTKSMAISFDTLGVAMPNTDAEFRTLLETMDTSTEEGAYLYGQVLLLADSFATMTGAVDDLGNSVEDTFNQLTDAWVGDLSYLTAQQKLDYTEGALELAKASSEDLSLVELSQLNAEQALATSRTRADYIPAFNEYVTAIADDVADATNQDLLDQLRILTQEIVTSRTETINAYIHTAS